VRKLRIWLAAAAALLLVGLGATAAADDASVQIDSAVLRWGMSNEANNAAHAPGTSNFFAAGRIPNPGAGNVKLPQGSWKQKSGNVAIEKWDGAAYRPATWAGLTSDKDGVAITSPTSGRYSDHQFVFSGGSGTVDATAGTAHIAWDGDVSVLFYSGFTFFYLSDPVLDVAGGSGTLTATLSGYGSSQANPDLWVEIPPETVTLADLPDVDLTDAAGFNALPAYDGVHVTVAGAPYTGSFPQSFVSFMDDAGTAPFWLNSGSSTDVAKKALALTVSYDAADPVEPAEPGTHTPNAPIDNDAPDPPKTVTRTITRTTTVPGAPIVPPPAAIAPTTAAALTSSPVLQLVSASPATVTETEDHSWAWWLGGGCLTLAVLVLAGAALAPFPAARRSA
jgi:hypothetical protein